MIKQKLKNNSKIIAFVVLAIFFFGTLMSNASPENSDGSREQACTCHGTQGASNIVITVLGFPTTYNPNQAYIVTVSVTSDIQAVTGDIAGNWISINIGALTESDVHLQVKSPTSITHFDATASSWTFNWTAPNSGAGTATLNVWTASVDNSGDTSGDTFQNVTFNSSEVIPEFTTILSAIFLITLASIVIISFRSKKL